MPSANLLTRRRPQPKPGVGATVDWSHPLASRLCFAALLNEWGATQCQDLVGQTRAPFTGSTKPSWLGGSRAGLSFPGGANTVGYLSFGAEASATDLGRNTGNPATIAFRMWWPSATAGSIAGRNDGNTVSAGWQIDVSTTSLLYTHESSVSNMKVTISPVPRDKWVTVVIVTDGSLTSANQRLYLNGVLVSHFADANGSGTPGSDAAQTLYVGRGNANYGLGNTGFAGSLDWVYCWKRMLSPAEVALLSRDPYAFLRDPAEVFVGVTSTPDPITGTGAVTVGAPTIDGAGSVGVAAAGGITIGAPAISGTGSVGVSGTGGVTIGGPAITGSGDAVPAPDARVTQVVAEVFGGLGMPDARVTQVVGEVFGQDAAEAWVTQVVAEVFGDPDILPVPPPLGTVAESEQPTDGLSLCGATTPLLFCELQLDDTVSPTLSAFYSWVDQPLNDPASQKQPRIVGISALRRALSDWSGRYDVAHGDITLYDADGAIRALILANTLIRKQIDIYLIDDVNRRAGDAPLRVGSYLVSDYDLLGDMTVKLSFEARLGGATADATLQKKIPYRRLDTTTFPNLPDALIGKCEPIPYGILSDEGYHHLGTVPIWYVGPRTMLDGNEWYEGLIAGCATWGPVSFFASNGGDRFQVASVSATTPAVVATAVAHGYATDDQVTITESDAVPSINGPHVIIVLSATTFSIPVDLTVAGAVAGGAAGIVTLTITPARVRVPIAKYATDVAFGDVARCPLWTTLTGETTKYLVRNGRRYTLAYFRQGSGIGEAFKDNTVPVLCNLGGVDEVGDGTGLVITSIARQTQHFLTNFVLQNHATDEDWYAIPITGNPAYSVIDADAFAAVKAVTEVRLPTREYEGAFILGGDLEPTAIGDWLQRLCLGGDMSLGTDRHGREIASIEDPSLAAVEDFTILNILKDSYSQKKDRQTLANVVSCWTFKNYAPPTSDLTPEPGDLIPAAPPGQTTWLTGQRIYSDGTSITALGGAPMGEREFHYEDWVTHDFLLIIPNNVIAYHLTRRTPGPDLHTLRTDLCGLDVELGEVFTVTHFAGLVPTTRRVRCLSVSLEVPNPFTKAFAVTLTGYDITDL